MDTPKFSEPGPFVPKVTAWVGFGGAKSLDSMSRSELRLLCDDLTAACERYERQKLNRLTTQAVLDGRASFRPKP